MAERFMEARDAHDLEEVTGLLAYPDVPDRYRLGFQMEQILGYRFDAIECVNDSEASPNNEFLVVCTYHLDSTLRQIEGLPPVEKSARVRVLETGIHPVIHGELPWLGWDWNGSQGFMTPDEEQREFVGFRQWLAAEHPSSSLFTGALGNPSETAMLILTPDNLRLLEVYLDEYERSANG
jgi:hypothetical protein